ncbi:hypothetical protein EON64_09225, partial [archaeon]
MDIFNNRNSYQDERVARNSIYGSSSNDAITTLRKKIKSIEMQKEPSLGFELVDREVEVCQEQVLFRKQARTVRRVYLRDHKYKIGWIADSDFDRCMLCAKAFSWWKGRAKHHCRACGVLVCHDCSPFATHIPHLEEGAGGSRVCKSCFGLKPGIFSPQPEKAPSVVLSK